MKVFVGTSGWFYGWNKEKSLDWYVQNSGLNAIELNASFYRFPYPNQVKAWARKGKNLRWSIKVNRLITHVHKLSRVSDTWRKFKRLFSPMEDMIDFYLLQLPPSFSPRLRERLEKFIKNEEKIVVEFRHPDWFGETYNFPIVSVDAPNLPLRIFSYKGVVYIRFHGRTSWYSYNYSKNELEEVASLIKEAKPRKVYAFFNNNHDMLNNARKFKEIMEEE